MDDNLVNTQKEQTTQWFLKFIDNLPKNEDKTKEMVDSFWEIAFGVGFSEGISACQKMVNASSKARDVFQDIALKVKSNG